MNVVLIAYCPSSAVYRDALVAAGAPPRLVLTDDPDPSAPALVARLRALPLDLLLVAGCPRVLREDSLASARVGAVNFHPSPLPDYRGKEPLFWQILRGEPATAITAHHLTADVDGGPILLQRAVAVPARATSASLAALVDAAGAALVPEILALAAEGSLPPGAPQGLGSRVPPLRPEHGLVDFTRSAVAIDRLVRACRGALAAYTFFRGMRLIVLEGEPSAAIPGAAAGRVLAVDDAAVHVGTGDGVYRIERFVFLDRVEPAPALAARLGLRAGDALSASPAF